VFYTTNKIIFKKFFIKRLTKTRGFGVRIVGGQNCWGSELLEVRIVEGLSWNSSCWGDNCQRSELLRGLSWNSNCWGRQLSKVRIVEGQNCRRSELSKVTIVEGHNCRRSQLLGVYPGNVQKITDQSSLFKINSQSVIFRRRIISSYAGSVVFFLIIFVYDFRKIVEAMSTQVCV